MKWLIFICFQGTNTAFSFMLKGLMLNRRVLSGGPRLDRVPEKLAVGRSRQVVELRHPSLINSITRPETLYDERLGCWLGWAGLG